jgi:nicotinate-nucleotide adenylyltransferase
MVCAQEAWWQLGLDGVVLVPVGDPAHRAIEADPGREERLRLCEAAAEGVDWMTVSRVDVDRAGQTYTVDTLDDLRGANPGDEHVFLLGADQAEKLPTWRDPERVLALAPLAVVERAGVTGERVSTALSGVGGEGRVAFFSMPRVDVSSTDVRARVAAGRPYRMLVPARVGDRIERQGLYR